jgi:hypothetical protein
MSRYKVQTRVCNRCRVEKALSLQNFEKRGTGWRGTCKDCRAADARARRNAGTARTDRGGRTSPALKPEDLDADILVMLEPTADAFELFYNRFAKLPLPDHARAWVEALLAYDETMVNCPPGHAKTTVLSIWFTIWTTCRTYRQAEVLIVSKTAGGVLAKVSRKLAHEFEFNNDLVDIFGPFRSADLPWRIGDGELEIDGHDRSKGSGDLSIQVRGNGQQILGMRADYLIADDVTDYEIARSNARRVDESQWWHAEVMTRLRPEGHCLVIGQRVYWQDLYGELADEVDDINGSHVWHVVKQPAILDWAANAALWPDIWSWAALMRMRRKVGPTAFETGYQQNPSPADDRTVAQLSWITGDEDHPGCLDKDRRLSHAPPLPGGVFAQKVRIMSVDPSGGAQYAAITVADVNYDPKTGEGYFHVIDLMRERLSYAKTMELLQEACLQYKPRVLIFEQNSWRALGRDAAADQLRQMVRPYDGVVIPHATNATTKGDQNYGLAAQGRLWELGYIRLPYEGPAAQEASKLLIDEAIGQAGTNDLLMSLWFITFNVRRFKAYIPGALPTHFRTPDGHVPGSSPWSRGRVDVKANPWSWQYGMPDKVSP